MKKYLAIILSLVMLISLSACGGNDNPDTPEKPDKQEQSSGNSDAAITTSLFSLDYDNTVWNYYDEETRNEEEYCYVLLQIPNPEDSEYYLVNAEITVSIDEPYDFREDLVYYGFDQYEYAVNNKYETVEIGGVDLLKYEKDDTLMYFNRVENAGATVTVKFDAEDTADTRIADLLKGLTISLEDTGNEDGPWEWEGTPFFAENKGVTVGSLKIQSQWIKPDEYISTFETFNHSVAADRKSVGYTVYDVNTIASYSDLNVSIAGSASSYDATAISQSIAEGTEVSPGTVITVTFSAGSIND